MEIYIYFFSCPDPVWAGRGRCDHYGRPETRRRRYQRYTAPSTGRERRLGEPLSLLRDSLLAILMVKSLIIMRQHSPRETIGLFYYVIAFPSTHSYSNPIIFSPRRNRLAASLYRHVWLDNGLDASSGPTRLASPGNNGCCKSRHSLGGTGS